MIEVQENRSERKSNIGMKAVTTLYFYKFT